MLHASAVAQEAAPAETYVPNTARLRGRLALGGEDVASIVYGWKKAFSHWHPELEWSISGGRVTRDFQAGKIDLVLTFEPLSPSQMAAYESAYGVRPASLKAAVWALGVYVNALNPSPGLSLERLESVFSAHFPEVRTWEELGLSGEWGRRPVLAFVRHRESEWRSRRSYFGTVVLRQAGMKESVREVKERKDVLEAVGSELGGLTFGDLSKQVPGTRLVAVGTIETEPVLPTAEHCWSGRYPLVRFLHLHARVPAGPEGDLVREFLRFVESREGEEIVRKTGMFPRR